MAGRRARPTRLPGRDRIALSPAMSDALKAHRAAHVAVSMDGLVFDRGDGQDLDPAG